MIRTRHRQIGDRVPERLTYRCMVPWIMKPDRALVASVDRCSVPGGSCFGPLLLRARCGIFSPDRGAVSHGTRAGDQWIGAAMHGHRAKWRSRAWMCTTVPSLAVALHTRTDQTNTIMDNSTGKTLLALAVGLAAGAVLGVLFAPRSGKETRAALRSKGDDLKEDLAEGIDQVRKEWSKAKGKVSDTVSDVKDEVTGAANDVADRAKRAADDAKQAVRSN